MRLPGQFHAFTIKHDGHASRIITDVQVCQAFDPASPPDPLPTNFATKALWDTGATQTVLAPETVVALGLVSVGKTNVNHGGGSAESCLTYLVNVILPNRVLVAGVLATELKDLRDSFGLIVGMDIICAGDLALTNVSGKTWMSFRTPSCEATDFVADYNKIKFGSVGRNDPCPCGSGKKFKKCHGVAT